jgi:hypothetical protein
VKLLKVVGVLVVIALLLAFVEVGVSRDQVLMIYWLHWSPQTATTVNWITRVFC